MVWLRGILFFVEKNICIFELLEFEVALLTFILASEPVFLNSWVFSLLDKLIVEAKPLAVLKDKGVVVAAFWGSWVDNHSSQIVHVGFIR